MMVAIAVVIQKTMVLITMIAQEKKITVKRRITRFCPTPGNPSHGIPKLRRSENLTYFIFILSSTPSQTPKPAIDLTGSTDLGCFGLKNELEIRNRFCFFCLWKSFLYGTFFNPNPGRTPPLG
jgi:hypothetical protein